MATMYGRGRGKAGSHAPKAERPYWLKLSEKEVEGIVVDLAKQGMTPVRIGLVLRDSYGVPSVKAVTSKKIQKILEEHNIKTQAQDITALEKRAAVLKKHLEKNKKDSTARRGLQLTKEKIRKLGKYYEKKK